MRSLVPINPYSTHQVASITVAIRTGILWPASPILELGCGHYSIPLFSSIAKMQGRKFQMITSDSEWAKQFQQDPDQIELIDFSMWPEFAFEGEWGMIFIDHEERVIDRYSQLFKVNEKAKVVVFHDANRMDDHEISWGLIHALYRHVYFYERYLPKTAILSNYVDPSEWFF